MDYPAAIKAVRTKQARRTNFLTVTLGYGLTVVLPHKAGIALLDALEEARVLEDNYGNRPRIVELPRDKVTSMVLSAEEFERIQVAQLLGIDLATLKLHEAEASTT